MAVAPTGATVGSTWAIAPSDVSMPSPIAVAPPTVRPASAVSSCCVSVVGGTKRAAVLEKSTMPMRGPPAWDLMNAAAASSAAEIRLGCTSVAHIEPETSRVSMIVADDEATGTVACGRAAPTARTARPRASSAPGIRRRQRDRPGSACAMSASEVTRTAARRRRCRVSHQAASTSGRARSVSSAAGQENDIQITRPVLVTVSTAPAASSTMAKMMNAPASGSGW